jgi:CheY-like chemotaxis protein
VAAQRDVQSPQRLGVLRRLTILLVEDEVLIRFAAADLLRGHGHEVVEAANGEEALAVLEAGLYFNLIVSDMRMPGKVNGVQLIEQSRERWPHIGRLLATSHWPEEGVNDTHFLPKPYTDAGLLMAVQKAAGPDPIE